MTALSFNDFVLYTNTRKLAFKGECVQIGSRAFDILAALAARAGEIVAKHELIKAVWPETHVDEGALRVHMVALRRALESKANGRIIANVPGKGYVLAASVEEIIHPTKSNPEAGLQNFPLSNRLFGRAELVSRLLMDNSRLATIAGPGGAGKTSIALSVGNHWLSTGVNVRFVDLNGITDVDQVLRAIVEAMGYPSPKHRDVRSIANLVGDREVSLIFDGCEHAVDDIAVVAERLLQSCPKLKILSTSREPLRAIGERVRFIGGLDLPGTNDAHIAENPAVRLFIETACASGADLDLDDETTLEKIVSIVSALEGLPLAIELAAGRITDLGIEGIVDGLSRPLDVLKFGRRTAAERHKSLRACISWGLGSLDTEEIAMLSKLSRKAASSMPGAPVGAGNISFTERDVFDRLISKSFISPAFAGNVLFCGIAVADLVAELPAGAPLKCVNSAAFAYVTMTRQPGVGPAH